MRCGLAVVCVWLSWGCGSSAVDECASTADALRSRLASADLGDEVCLAAVAVEGQFVVPPGVTLFGEDRETSLITSTTGTAVRLETDGSHETVLRDMSIESDGAEAVLGAGTGAMRVEAVDVTLTLGVGVKAEGLASVALSSVHVVGPVTPENVEEHSGAVFEAGDATHGVLLDSIEEAELQDVSARGLALLGVILANSGSSWIGALSSRPD